MLPKHPTNEMAMAFAEAMRTSGPDPRMAWQALTAALPVETVPSDLLPLLQLLILVRQIRKDVDAGNTAKIDDAIDTALELGHSMVDARMRDHYHAVEVAQARLARLRRRAEHAARETLRLKPQPQEAREIHTAQFGRWLRCLKLLGMLPWASEEPAQVADGEWLGLRVAVDTPREIDAKAFSRVPVEGGSQGLILLLPIAVARFAAEKLATSALYSMTPGGLCQMLRPLARDRMVSMERWGRRYGPFPRLVNVPGVGGLRLFVVSGELLRQPAPIA